MSQQQIGQNRDWEVPPPSENLGPVELTDFSDPDMLRKILRSMCLDSPQYKNLAIDNYRSTDVALLKLTGVAKNFYERVRGAMGSGGPPTWQFIDERAGEFNELELAGYAREIGTEKFYWGSDFTTLLKEYIERMGGEYLAVALNKSLEILREGYTPEDRDAKELKGVFDSINFVQRETTQLQRDIQFQKFSYHRSEAAQLLRRRYEDRQNNPGASEGAILGITPLDEATRGGKSGELWTMAGFVGHGKSTIALNWALNAAIYQMMNVYFYTLEMDPIQAYQIMASAYANHKKWRHERDRIIMYERIKRGTLNREDSLFYNCRLLPDLERNPLYGQIVVEKPSKMPTISEIWARAEAEHQARGIDMIIIDYVSLLAADGGGRKSKQETLAENIMAAKHMAMEFNRGKGVLVATPHQINRKGYAAAVMNNGVYEMDALADSSEIERSSDVVFCVYQDRAYRSLNKAVITHLKNRDGVVLEPFNISMDQRSRLIGVEEELDSGEGPLLA